MALKPQNGLHEIKKTKKKNKRKVKQNVSTVDYTGEKI